jgi:hypothetical protein
MCTEVAEKVDEAAELGPRIHTWELGPDKPEFDRIDLCNQTNFENRADCSTCQALAWYFKIYRKAGYEITSMSHHLIISLQLHPIVAKNLEDDGYLSWPGFKGLVILLV